MTNPDLTPRAPSQGELAWSDVVLDLQDFVLQQANRPSLYIVGGAVRDALLRRPIKDIDLATPGDAIQLARQITNAFDGDIFVMDTDRGVARVFIDTPHDGRVMIDVVRFRGDSLLADLVARDFTINAMTVDLTGDLSLLIDPLNGEADLRAKMLRACAPSSLVDDPLRALRAVRQSVQLGLRLHPELRRDVADAAVRLNDVSPERVRDEFVKVLALPRPGAAFRVLMVLGLLQQIIPELTSLIGMTQPPPYARQGWEHTLDSVENMTRILTAISPRRTDSTAAVFDLGMMVMQFDRYREALNQHLFAAHPNDRSHHYLLILAALLAGTGKSLSFEHYAEHSAKIAEKTADYLRLSNPEKKALVTMVAQHRRWLDDSDLSPLEQHRFWYQFGVSGIDAMLLGLAEFRATAGNELAQNDWLVLIDRVTALLSTYFDRYEDVVMPPPVIDGNALMDELNLSGGPIVGTLINVIREGQVIGIVTDRTSALAVARRYLDEQPG